MKYHTTITLPAVRAAQLRHVAQKRGATPLEIIDAFVRAAWANVEGEGAALPGLELATDLDDDTGTPVVCFGANDLMPILLTPEQAQAVAHGLSGLLDGTASRFGVDALHDGHQSRFMGSRKGRGYVLTIYDKPEDESREPVQITGLTASVAEDLAASFAAYAAKAAALVSQDAA